MYVNLHKKYYRKMNRILLVFAAGLITLCAVKAFSLIPGDNSLYLEGRSRFIWMPDGDGVPHLVDLQVPINETAVEEAIKNSANNEYWLFTRRNPSNRQLLVHGNANSIWGSNYLASRPTKVIVHGWKSNGNSHINPLITSAFLAVQDCNVIVLDWRNVAEQLYPISKAGVPNVGDFLGKFLIWLFNTAGGNWNNLHLVGFGLGAHVVGNAGRTAYGRPLRITGLDAAGPLWRESNQALNALSGQYVEAIHTDGGALGIFDKIAHADFYPNGGRHPQPGCRLGTCSHRRAYELFASTVRHNNLVGCECSRTNKAEAKQCNGALHMGNNILSKKGSGTFCLSTTGRPW